MMEHHLYRAAARLTAGVVILLIGGCGVPPAARQPAPPTAVSAAVQSDRTAEAASIVVPTVPPTAASTSTPELSPTTPPTSTPIPAPRLCSPLGEVPLPRLTEIVTNPYNPPPPGSDDPHQAVDLAVMLPGSRVAVAGSPVQAALGGRVAGVIRDRFPYGSAILIETPLENFPVEWWQPADIPTPAPTLAYRAALTCPPGPDPVIADPERRSLYILYAHLQAPPALKPGDPVTCGQVIGTVGDSGNALNPHLHFEVRAGPAGIDLPSMAHYDASASPEEMLTYCQWRISGLFQLVDPNRLLNLSP